MSAAALRVAIRTDASRRIGTGHVMRCLALAGELRRCGAQVRFVCRALEGHLGNLIATEGFAVELLPAPAQAVAAGPGGEYADWLGVDWETDAAETQRTLSGHGPVDWLIVDHYALDARWHARLRASARRILAIDDLAERPQGCDLLLDQNLRPEAAPRDLSLVPAGCRVLQGPRHALLRPEFAAARRSVQPRDGVLRRLLVFFGGVDAGNDTARVIDVLRQLAWGDVAADVVLGPAHGQADRVAALCAAAPNLHLHRSTPGMAALMAAADLAIGASGTTTWERACLGLPSVAVAIAANQETIARAAAAAGIVEYLGTSPGLDSATIGRALAALRGDPERLRAMSRAGMALVDGQGADRVAAALHE